MCVSITYYRSHTLTSTLFLLHHLLCLTCKHPRPHSYSQTLPNSNSLPNSHTLPNSYSTPLPPTLLQFITIHLLTSDLAKYPRACSQCSAPKHLAFKPTFPQKTQTLFSREVKDLVILPILKEICKLRQNERPAMLNSLWEHLTSKVYHFFAKNATSLIWFNCSWKENYVFFS